MKNAKPETVDSYIAGFPEDIRKLLIEIRKTIRKAAPDAEEKISYHIPTFVCDGILVHFAAFKNHIGLYALPSGNQAFQNELSAYKTGKGSIQFPLDQPMPLELIAKIVQFRLRENAARMAIKKTKK